MSDHHTQQDTDNHEVAVGHEASELNIAPIVWFLIGLTVATVVVCLLTAGLFNALRSRVEGSAGAESPLASERQKLPPEPRLQLAPTTIEQIEGAVPPDLKHDHPLQEMKQLREEAEKRLKSYGWVDEKAGIARIPIDEAKRIWLEKEIQIRKR